MKSRMKCFSFLALIAFGFGYSDLLVRPCWAHNNGSQLHLLLHGVDHALHDAINGAGDAVDAAVDAAVEELKKWVDSGGEVIHYVPSGPSTSSTVPASEEAAYQVVGALNPSPPGVETNTTEGVKTDPNCFEGQANPDPECN